MSSMDEQGIMLRDDKGRFLPGSVPSGTIRTSERGRELAQRRHEVARIKARQAIADAYAEHAGKQGARPTDAYAGMADEFARSAYANALDKPREAVEAGKFALRLADMLPADERATAVAAVSLTLNITPAGAAVLRELVGDVVEGEYK